MMTDVEHSSYEQVAQTFIEHRSQSTIGAATVRKWAQSLSSNAEVLDMGCGHGIPISACLHEQGCQVFGIDSSPTLIAHYQQQFPQSRAACEAIETSTFFNRQFDGIIAWGLLFLLSPETQSDLIRRSAHALHPGGQFLFTAPEMACTWTDIMTSMPSQSLGKHVYEKILQAAGFKLRDTSLDEGDNFYYFAERI